MVSVPSMVVVSVVRPVVTAVSLHLLSAHEVMVTTVVAMSSVTVALEYGEKVTEAAEAKTGAERMADENFIVNMN